MSKASKNAVKMWRAAVSLAGDCVVENSGLPDKQEITAIACALLSAGLVSAGKDDSNPHAGQDAEQTDMLNSAFEEGH
jgi:hypothetical protein